MSDIPKYLPLSQRPRRDESGVTGNWAAAAGAVLNRFAGIVESLTDEQWMSPSARPDSTVSDATNEAIWLVTSTRLQRLQPGRGAKKLVPLTRARAAIELRAAAAAALDPAAKRNLGTLSAAVLGTVDVARSAGLDITIDPLSTGAVALARSLSAPLPIRAIVRETSLAATDADWRIGIGPVRYGTAAAIILFLYGRGPLPDDPAPATS